MSGALSLALARTISPLKLSSPSLQFVTQTLVPPKSTTKRLVGMFINLILLSTFTQHPPGCPLLFPLLSRSCLPSKHARSGQCWPSVGRVGKTSANLPTLCQCCQCFANIFANAVIIVEVSFLEFFHDCVMILGHFLLLIAFQFAKNTFF